jgi:hypothetical protein
MSMLRTAATAAAALSSLVAFAPTSLGQAAGQPIVGIPDVIVSRIGSTSTRFGTVQSGISAFGWDTVSCNIGTGAAVWFVSGSRSREHPVISQVLYRLHDGRLEQISDGFVKHGWCAADSTAGGGCSSLVSPPGQTQSEGSCNWLGLFTTDTYTASMNGAHRDMGPRSEINPTTGVFPFPYVIGQGLTSDTNNPTCIYKRMQVRNADLDRTTFAGARYFAEVHYITTDEPANRRRNNASYREIWVSLTQTPTGSACTTAGWNLTFTNPSTNVASVTQVFKTAIEAWKDVDPTVKLQWVTVPGDGMFAVGSRVTNNGDGTWTYEYALYNHNSHRGASSFSLDKGTGGSTAFRGVSMRDVPAEVASNSGENFDKSDWVSDLAGAEVKWTAQAPTGNQTANFLRWASTYNFRFSSTRAPTTGAVQIGLFRTGAAGEPASVSVAGLDVPSVPPPPPVCAVDFDNDGVKGPSDIFAFLNAYFAQDLRADWDQSGALAPADIFSFLSAYFSTTCP